MTLSQGEETPRPSHLHTELLLLHETPHSQVGCRVAPGPADRAERTDFYPDLEPLIVPDRQQTPLPQPQLPGCVQSDDLVMSSKHQAVAGSLHLAGRLQAPDITITLS